MEERRDLNEHFMKELDKKLGITESDAELSKRGWKKYGNAEDQSWVHSDHPGHAITTFGKDKGKFLHSKKKEMLGRETVGKGELSDISDYLSKFHDGPVSEARYEFSNKALLTTPDNKSSVYIPSEDDPEAREVEDRTLKQGKAYAELGMVKAADKMSKKGKNMKEGVADDAAHLIATGQQKDGPNEIQARIAQRAANAGVSKDAATGADEIRAHSQRIRDRENSSKSGTNESEAADLDNAYDYHEVHKDLVDKGYDYQGWGKGPSGEEVHRYHKDGEKVVINRKGQKVKESQEDEDWGDLFEKVLPILE